MRFASPVSDYVECQLTPELLCNMRADSRALETNMGFAVIEPEVIKTARDVLLILCDGNTQFAKLQGQSLITSDGEGIEGEAMEG